MERIRKRTLRRVSRIQNNGHKFELTRVEFGACVSNTLGNTETTCCVPSAADCGTVGLVDLSRLTAIGMVFKGEA